MATYNNPHWLLSHIRNSFISTDDTGMCETVMLSDDLPKHYLKNFQTPQQQRTTVRKVEVKNNPRPPESVLTEVDFICYPGLDQSDDEDIDLASQSFDIQMYPEIGAYRFRSNTAQKLEKMDIARRKAARTKCVNFEDQSNVGGERSDLFQRKTIVTNPTEKKSSRLSLQLINSPKQTANKFIEFARFDGASHTGIQTKRINVFINMLPEKERSYPMKICVLPSAKIQDVIGFICYRCVLQYPDIPLKSIRHYGLYMTEDNDDMDDFPPLDVREPCSKFGFSHLTLAERRPLAHVTRVDYPSLSMTSEDEKAGDAAVRDVHGSGGNLASYEERMMDHNDMIDAPMYRTYKLNIIDKRFFKSEVQLGISGERIEIDQQKNSSKFWTKQKAMTYPIESIAFCEIIERRQNKAIIRIWIKPNQPDGYLSSSKHAASMAISGSPASPQHFNITTCSSSSSSSAPSVRFKHYDFETEPNVATHIFNKMNFILDVRSSDNRRDFIAARERKLEKHGRKKN